MLLLASTIITRPNLAQYRFEILTALWCRYGTTAIASYYAEKQSSEQKATQSSEQKATSPKQTTAAELQPEIYLTAQDAATKQLVEWFSYAVFGKHATKHEVEKFLTRSAIWLPKLTLESEEVKGHLKPPTDPNGGPQTASRDGNNPQSSAEDPPPNETNDSGVVEAPR